MSDTPKFLKLIQEDCFARLQIAQDFSTVGLILARKAVVAEEVVRKQGVLAGRGGKVGTCVIVEMPKVRVDSPNVPGPSTEPNMSFLVYEQPEINAGSTGSGISAEQLAIDCLQLFHQFIPYGITQVLIPETEAILPDYTFKNLVGYRVGFTTRVALKHRPKVGLPTISPKSGAAPLELTLVCPTSGASIFYSLDNSYPSSAGVAGGTSFLYSAPFTLAEAGTVRVAAEKTGLMPSDVAQTDFS